MGVTVDDPATCGDALDQALAFPGPALVEAVVDPFEPPLPAKITIDQAKKFAESLVKGQPARGDIVKTILKDRVRELI
jgi:pyruvate dehydrogenase (quinone)/pyruvate oxidase